jgi:hypothetical protein
LSFAAAYTVVCNFYFLGEGCSICRGLRVLYSKQIAYIP